MVWQEHKERKGDLEHMKNTFIRAFSLSSDAEKIIDIYAAKKGIKSKSKALDTMLKDYDYMARSYENLLRKYRKSVKESIKNDSN